MTQQTASLSEVHQSIDTSKAKGKWGKIFAFFGPAYLVSVGYMDPGNWATDIAGGSAFGYKLLWVLLLSNLMALLLQSFSARLGLVYGRDLAQASRETYPKSVTLALYFLAEIAIAACDLAEVLGMAIGLKLLTGLPIIWGVAFTILDTFILLFLQRLGMRRMEIFIIGLVTIIGLSFSIELFYAHPSGSNILQGLIPSFPGGESFKPALYIAIGIIGATVMPHNLYLHSALVQTRKFERNPTNLRRVIKLTNIDSTIALNLALFVNASILILAAATFYRAGYINIASIEEAHNLLIPLLGTALAPTLFAVALIASGQSSTITGTLAGQVIMEGYLHLRMPMWIRRLITRLLAVVPAFFAVRALGEAAAGDLLVLSQVILSLQLAFAVIPLLHFVSDPAKMGDLRIGIWARIGGWAAAILIIGFNGYLVWGTLTEWFATIGSNRIWAEPLILLLVAGILFLLGYITFQPFIARKTSSLLRLPHGSDKALLNLEPRVYHRVAVTVDFSSSDEPAIANALAQGGKNAEYLLIHVVETPAAILKEGEVQDAEANLDATYVNNYVKVLKEKGYSARTVIGYGHRVKTISDLVAENKADLLVMGSHGHRAFSDLFRGETINSVRHRVAVPLLAVK